MNTLNFENLGLTPISNEECLSTQGGCGSWWWCPERIAAEVGKAGEEFSKMFNEGWNDFDIH